MRVECSCGKTLTVKDDLIGKRIRCPGCGEAILVSDDDDEPAEQLPKRKSSKASGKKGRKSKAKGGLPVGWIIGGGVGVVAVIGAILAAMFLLSPGKDASPPQAAGPGATPAAAGGAASPAAATTPSAASYPLAQYKNAIALDVSADGKWLATFEESNEARYVKLWDLATGAELKTFGKEHSSKALRFSPSGKLLVSTGKKIHMVDGQTRFDNEMLVWTVPEFGEPKIFPVEGYEIDFSKDESIAYVWRFSQGLRVIELATGNVLATIGEKDEGQTVCAVSVEAGIAAIELSTVGGPPPIIHTYRLDNSQRDKTFGPPGNESLIALDFSTDGKVLVGGTSTEVQPKLCAANWADLKEWKVITLTQAGQIVDVKVSSDGKYVCALQRNALTTWTWEAGALGASMLSGGTGSDIAHRTGTHEFYICGPGRSIQILDIVSGLGQLRDIGPRAAR